MTQEMMSDYQRVSVKELVRQLPKRIVEVFVKLFSYRTVVLGVTIWLVRGGFVGDYAFVILAGIAIFGRDFLKIVEKVKK